MIQHIKFRLFCKRVGLAPTQELYEEYLMARKAGRIGGKVGQAWLIDEQRKRLRGEV